MTNVDTKRQTNFAVTLTPCHLKENTYIARVPRRTVTTDQILDLVAAHNQGIDRYQIGHAMELLKKEILEQAELGYAVDVLEICKLYIAPKGSVTSLMPEAETVTGFEARFRASTALREKLEGVSAAVTAVTVTAPQISRIEDPSDGASDSTLTATFSARIKGRKLKVGGTECGIFLIPADTDGGAAEDESEWIPVPESFITKNTAGTLEFYLPRSLEVGGSYFIAVRTAVSSGSALKTPVTGISRIAVTVKAAS